MSGERKYVVNEVFFSVQGEGRRAGTANVFVRFAGCNLRCDIATGPLSPGGFACDTEFTSGRAMTAAQLFEECVLLDVGKHRAVIFTGGEPLLQLDDALLRVFRAASPSWHVAVETNGTLPLDERAPGAGVDWVTLSPKVADHALKLRTCDELKVVRGYGQEIPKYDVTATYKLISPAFDGESISPRTLAWCVDLVKMNAPWQLSVQQHKGWGVR